MSAPAAADAAPKPKGKKTLIMGVVAVLLLAIAAAAWMLLGRGHGDEEEEAAAPPAAHAKKGKDALPPTYLPMENMVVNLADAGGEKFAQIGVTLEVMDQKTADQVKAHLPGIRSAVLLLASQRTSEELLTRDGKEKLARDILREASHPLGYEVEEDDPPAQDGKTRRRSRPVAFNPIYRVLFSSFIIQ
ncbi:flagellar basal body-associated FliL family protein [Pseudorhodoferax sp.]|uniref:flagellar basal body-associated FliL family protein n=1 Tax=Pseudorhodoferax sp. TaxID=1993553 RepID=UPI002DD66C5E|nr:flagellar basal body-associated FliL family protein [Pseudorhodoferax sp.]